MKKALAATILILLTISVFSQQNKVNWYSFEEAVQLNSEQPKKILVDVYTDWCGWCKKMKKETFNHPKIAEYINQHFYPVRFDAESKQKVHFKGKTFSKSEGGRRKPHQLAIALLKGKMSYPSVAYMDENNNLITAVPGYFTPKQIEPILKYFVNDVYKKKGFDQFRKNFEHTLTDK